MSKESNLKNQISILLEEGKISPLEARSMLDNLIEPEPTQESDNYKTLIQQKIQSSNPQVLTKNLTTRGPKFKKQEVYLEQTGTSLPKDPFQLQINTIVIEKSVVQESTNQSPLNFDSLDNNILTSYKNGAINAQEAQDLLQNIYGPNLSLEDFITQITRQHEKRNELKESTLKKKTVTKKKQTGREPFKKKLATSTEESKAKKHKVTEEKVSTCQETATSSGQKEKTQKFDPETSVEDIQDMALLGLIPAYDSYETFFGSQLDSI